MRLVWTQRKRQKSSEKYLADMLRSLTIKNLVLIGDARLEFSQGLNVLSGETGAGKSIIVDAIMLLIGEKYDKSL